MAEKKGAKPEEAKPEGAKTVAAPAKGSKKNRLIMIIAIAVVVLGAGGAWWYFNRDQDHEEVAKATPALPPVFVPLEAFTVNLQPGKDGAQQYMQIGITLKVAGQPVADKLKDQMPEVRSRLLMALSAKKASELLSPEGKSRLAEELMLEVVTVIDPETAKKLLAATQPRLPVSVAAAAPETKTDAGEQKPEGAPAEAGANAKAADAPAEADADAKTADAAAEETPAESGTDTAAGSGVPSPVLSVLFTSFIIQ